MDRVFFARLEILASLVAGGLAYKRSGGRRIEVSTDEIDARGGTQKRGQSCERKKFGAQLLARATAAPLSIAAVCGPSGAERGARWTLTRR